MLRAVVILVVILISAGMGRAEDGTPNSAKTFYFENDVFYKQDRHYTNGLKYSWLTDDPTSFYIRRSAQLPFIETFWPGYKRQVVESVGQNIYTPKDIELTELIPNDRPYAGWLYYSVDLLVINGFDYNQLGITAGIVGPWSLAEQTQKLVHRTLTTAAIPRGWDNQLKNEPGLILTYDKKYKFSLMRDRWIEFDVIPHWGASLGNVMTNLRGGGMVRMGHNVPHDFGTPRMPSALMAEHLKREHDRHSEYGFYFFALFEKRYVAHNIFLDGNTFTESHHVSKKPVVYDYDMGAALVFPTARRGVPDQIVYRSVFRTEEFYEQDAPDRYGSLMFEWWY